MVIPCLCSFFCIPVDIPADWELQQNLTDAPVRVAFADFSAAPWQGFEKSERGPSLGSLFPPQAAVASAAVLVLSVHAKNPKSYDLGFLWWTVQDSNL